MSDTQKLDIKIIDIILKSLHMKKTLEEKKTILSTIDNLYRKKLMIEKNLSSKANEDSFSLGGFCVSKERESNVNMVKMSETFRNKYLDETEKEVYDVLSTSGANGDDYTKYFILLNTLKRDKIANEKLIPLNDIFNYKIE